LRDAIEYELPLGALGQLGGGWFVRGMLEKLFAFRHDVTRRYVDGEAT
jgi:ligand-binding SRPBCC domain-containing protein